MHRLTWRRAPACTLHAALAAPDLQFAAVQFLRVYAAFFLSYSLYVVFGEGEKPLLQRRVSLPPQAPPALPALWACRCVLHTAYFLCWSLQFVFFALRAGFVFLCGALCGVGFAVLHVSDSQ